MQKVQIKKQKQKYISGDERGSRNVITVSNATTKKVYVETHPIELVRRTNLRAVDCGLGLDASGLGGSLQVKMQHDPTSRRAWGRLVWRRMSWNPGNRQFTLTPAGGSRYQDPR